MAQQVVQKELSAQEKQKLVKQAQETIERIKNDLLDPTSTVTSMWKTSHKNIIRLWEDNLAIVKQYEGAPLNTIANEVLHEMQRLKLVDQDYTYVYDVSPAIYKGYTPNPDYNLSDKPSKNSSLNTPVDAKQENQPLTSRFRAVAQQLNEFANFLDQTHCMSNMNDNELEQTSELLGILDTGIKLGEQVTDKRQSLPTPYSGLFWLSLADGGISSACSVTFVHARDIITMVSKQGRKTWAGNVSEVLQIYEPANEVDAQRRGYIGSPCPECRSLRIKELVKTNPKTRAARPVDYCHACHFQSEILIKRTKIFDKPKHQEAWTVDESAEQYKKWQLKNGICPVCSSIMKDVGGKFVCPECATIDESKVF